mmetsp:Transcript_11438/g.18133  ORF Transcript_11438/g.18133 Transcript_11438/m.18133 type:complete len:101 (+) Transcript_11438:1494-1796(+)
MFDFTIEKFGGMPLSSAGLLESSLSSLHRWRDLARGFLVRGCDSSSWEYPDLLSALCGDFFFCFEPRGFFEGDACNRLPSVKGDGFLISPPFDPFVIPVG